MIGGSVDGWRSGAAGILTATFVVAGITKVVSPSGFAYALPRLSPPGWPRFRRREAFVMARALGATEVAVAFLLWPMSTHWVASIVTLSLTFVFLLSVCVAVRLGTSCGCWSSLSETQAGGGEIGRAVAVLTFAILVVASNGAPWRPRLVLPPLVFETAFLIGLAQLGRRIRPPRTEQLLFRYRASRSKSATGALVGDAHFLLGSVVGRTPKVLNRQFSGEHADSGSRVYQRERHEASCGDDS